MNGFQQNIMNKNVLFFHLDHDISVTSQGHNKSKHVHCFLSSYTLQHGIYHNERTSPPYTGTTVNNLKKKHTISNVPFQLFNLLINVVLEVKICYIRIANERVDHSFPVS